MQKFKFNLARIPSLKIRKEDLLKQEMQRLLFKRKQHEDVKAHYSDKLLQEYQKMKSLEKFKPEDYLTSENYLFGIKNQIINQTLMISEYEIKVDKKRKEIFENRKEIKTLEKLKEKKHEEYQYEVMLDERKLMDEIANRKLIKARV